MNDLFAISEKQFYFIYTNLIYYYLQMAYNVVTIMAIRKKPGCFPCFLCMYVTQMLGIVVYALVVVSTAYSPDPKKVDKGEKVPL